MKPFLPSPAPKGKFLRIASLLLFGAVAVIPTLSAERSDSSRETDAPTERTVIDLRWEFEVQHEATGHPVHQRSRPAMLVPGESTNETHRDRDFGRFAMEIQADWDDGTIRATGEFYVTQSAGIGQYTRTDFIRFKRSFDAGLELGERTQVLGPDERSEDGRIISLYLTASPIESRRATQWLFREIGRLTDAIARSFGQDDREAALTQAQRANAYAKAFADAAMDSEVLSRQRVEELEELFSRLVEEIEGGERAGARTVIEDIDYTGILLREELALYWQKAENSD